MAQLTEAQILAFQKTVWNYFDTHARTMPWRQPRPDGNFDPYEIMVSEMMLQQTQVLRTIPKFEQFITIFPTINSLARQPLGSVLKAWDGLGYNRRAKFLWQAAQIIVEQYHDFPSEVVALQKLPGIGVNTAGAIRVYAFNLPAVFLETNIRTVFIHHFFATLPEVDDQQIIKLVEQTLVTEQPRQWYWALMDYGAYLKATVGNLSKTSKSYTKQPTFKGSRRQLRGQIIHLLTTTAYSKGKLKTLIVDPRLRSVLADLQQEGLIRKIDAYYELM